MTFWPFYDGDFAFHARVYPDDSRSVFRVRSDSDPIKRAHENLTNLNKAEPGWKRISPATIYEIVCWYEKFKEDWPLRPDSHTRAIKSMKPERCGNPLSGGLPDLYEACKELCMPIKVVQNFKLVKSTFAKEISPGCFCLTDDGEWLSNLIV